MNKKFLALSMLAGSLYATGAFAQTGGQTTPGSLDMTGSRDPTPSEYAVLPVQRGHLKEVTQGEFVGDEVKSKRGNPIGTLEKLIMDTKTNKIEYGVVSLADSGMLMPFAWSNFKVNRDGEVRLNVTRDQIQPLKSIDEAKDLSPDIKKIVSDMQAQMGKPIQPGLGVQKVPASGGGQGEDQAATGGPSGPRADPLPGKTPR